ncbi:6567_t:CDS:1, partial [Gigaspora rosea]
DSLKLELEQIAISEMFLCHVMISHELANEKSISVEEDIGASK